MLFPLVRNHFVSHNWWVGIKIKKNKGKEGSVNKSRGRFKKTGEIKSLIACLSPLRLASNFQQLEMRFN